MVTFNGLSLPHVIQAQQQKTRIFYELTIPNRAFDYRVDLGGLGDTFTINGWLQSADLTARAQINNLVGSTGILDLQEANYQPFDAVLYNQQSSGFWTVDTTPAYVLGTPFSVLSAGTDLMYFGFHQRWNLMQFIFWVFGSYGKVWWEYSQGNGYWNILTTYTDGTLGFTQNGAVTLTPPSDWAPDTVNGVANLFWLRVGTGSVTAIATINQLLLNPCYQCILQNPLYTFDPTIYDHVTYQLSLQQAENPFTPVNAYRGFDPLSFDGAAPAFDASTSFDPASFDEKTPGFE